MLPTGFHARPFAHRALHGPGRPENSRSAIDAAMAAGYGIELDLQLSGDCQAMVFHDYALDRLTCARGPVRGLGAERLSSIQLNDSEEGIPTLRQVLDQVAGAVPLLIEVKDQDGALGPDVGPLEEATAACLADYPGPAAVMSFNPHSVARLGQLLPDLPRGLTTDAFAPEVWPTVPPARLNELRAMPDLVSLGAKFISHRWDDLTNPAVAAARAKGLRIFCWTIRSDSDQAAALENGADQVTFEGYLA
ncbi:glycerophosphodiester phosphodiesterase family protein [Salibaculum sp.]|uniref:glycerophosphodiester phosphodiesterase family protein n=1 Tax=Salibaculum sp. TaxID=2855480 RepID=UPI002B4A6A77|nr:glycerophosphodiester phosphodiesterase family protein [Salibaculum sp.]HKL70891.1 glycerophosphodiester phosphodiesterase family protein [Salibaculum sp.]